LEVDCKDRWCILKSDISGFQRGYAVWLKITTGDHAEYKGHIAYDVQ